MVDLGSLEGADRHSLGAHQSHIAEGAFEDLVVDAATAAEEGLFDLQLSDFMDVVVVYGA